MKTTLCLTLTLLTFVMLAFVPNSFAQDTSPEYVVRVTYFYPSDREPSDALEAKLDAMVKDIQQFYADEMERHGFGRKTFRLETDENGNIVKHRFNGKFTSSHYKPTFDGNPAASNEFFEHFDRSEHIINLILVDGVLENPDHYGIGGVGDGDSFSGYAASLIYSFDKVINSDNYRVYLDAWSTTAHELGHAFGLRHDFRDDRYVMSYGDEAHRSQLSYCAAKWLDAHRYFNATQNDFGEKPKIRMLESFLVSPPNTVRLRFEITHTAELHHAFLEIGLYNMVDCESLSGNSDTIEFVTTDLVPQNQLSVKLYVIDVHGNFTSVGVPIDTAFLLPDTAPEIISIPDMKLAAAVRKSLRLAEESPITNHDMLNLVSLRSSNSSQITDLTGLEYALNLKRLPLGNNQIVDLTPLSELKYIRYLHLGRNQITDIKPLAGLKQLRELILEDNQITDIKPLAGLTNLHQLSIGRCQISDISPLSELTNLYQLYLFDSQIRDITSLAKLKDLRELHLPRNQITDVSPLAELTNLQEIHLYGNPIKNRKPLLELLRKNPDVKIYLQSVFVPLNLEALTNNAPVFTAKDSTMRTRTVAENTGAGVNIGTAVSATDEDGDTLTYSLDETSAIYFSIDSSTGQLKTLAALDYETTLSYTVWVTASDGKESFASIRITINIMDLDDDNATAFDEYTAVKGKLGQIVLSEFMFVSNGELHPQWFEVYRLCLHFICIESQLMQNRQNRDT